MMDQRLRLGGITAVIGMALVLGACNKGGGGGGNSIMMVDFVDSSASSVSLGEQGLPVTMRISNPGSRNLAAVQGNLTFMMGTTDVSADFSVTPDSANPIGIDAGSADILTFYVDVLASAPLGLVTISGVASAAGVSQATAQMTDTWDVRGASMTVDLVESPYTTVGIGERMAPVSMQITNPGPGDLVRSRADLQFLLGPADVSST